VILLLNSLTYSNLTYRLSNHIFGFLRCTYLLLADLNTNMSMSQCLLNWFNLIQTSRVRWYFFYRSDFDFDFRSRFFFKYQICFELQFTDSLSVPKIVFKVRMKLLKPMLCWNLFLHLQNTYHYLPISSPHFCLVAPVSVKNLQKCDKINCGTGEAKNECFEVKNVRFKVFRVLQNLKDQIYRIHWIYCVEIKFLFLRNTQIPTRKYDYEFGMQGPTRRVIKI